MTAPGTLLTREEIAEIIGPFCKSIHGGPNWSEPCHEHVAMANALLARLRPAWETHEKCIEEIQRDQLAVAERENELHDEKDRQIDALRADLRACAEALDRILPAMVTVTRWIKDHVKDLPGLEDGIENMVDSVEQACAALTRPGTQQALGK